MTFHPNGSLPRTADATWNHDVVDAFSDVTRERGLGRDRVGGITSAGVDQRYGTWRGNSWSQWSSLS